MAPLYLKQFGLREGFLSRKSIAFRNGNKNLLLRFSSNRRWTLSGHYSWLSLTTDFLKSHNFPVLPHVLQLHIFPRISDSLRSRLVRVIVLFLICNSMVVSSQENNGTGSTSWVMPIVDFWKRHCLVFQRFEAIFYYFHFIWCSGMLSRSGVTSGCDFHLSKSI